MFQQKPSARLSRNRSPFPFESSEKIRSVILATRAGGEPRPHARAFADVLHEVAAELAVELQRRIQDR